MSWLRSNKTSNSLHLVALGSILVRVGSCEFVDVVVSLAKGTIHETRYHRNRLLMQREQKVREEVTIIRTALILLIFVSSVAAQDPVKVAPDAYKLEFENDWVKVVRVHYGPRARIPVHDHPRWGTAYVYLNDSGEVIFKHKASDRGAITRPPTKAGAFRLFKGVKEVHEVENTTDLPSDFLRVEFKTRPVGESTLRGRYYRQESSGNENYQKVQFENEQIRITRIICAASQTLELASDSGQPSLFVALTPGSLSVSDLNGSVTKLDVIPGQTRWFGSEEPQTLKNLVATNAEFLRFDFKTAPRRTRR